MKLWHFTSTAHLPRILADGYLRPSDSMLHPVDQNFAPPCVWLLDSPDLGEASHGLNTPFSTVDKQAVRFTVEVPDSRVVRWLGWAEAQDVDPLWLTSVIDGGGGREAAERWCCIFRRIPSDQWLSVDQRVDGYWCKTT